MEMSFGDLNDCYGRALQQELAEANRLEQEMIEAGLRESDAYYAEMRAKEDNVDCGNEQTKENRNGNR